MQVCIEKIYRFFLPKCSKFINESLISIIWGIVWQLQNKLWIEYLYETSVTLNCRIPLCFCILRLNCLEIQTMFLITLIH